MGLDCELPFALMQHIHTHAQRERDRDSVHSAHNHDHIISLNSKSLKWIKGEITNSLNADTHARLHVRIAKFSSAQRSSDHI